LREELDIVGWKNEHWIIWEILRIVFYYSNTKNNVLLVFLLLFVVYVNYVCMIQYDWLIFCHFSKWRWNIEKPTESDVIPNHIVKISRRKKDWHFCVMQFYLLKPPLNAIFCTLEMLLKCPKAGRFKPVNMNQI
jgi:hypothetical protein